MKIKQFLTEIFGNCSSGYINIWTLQDKKSRWYTVNETEKIADFVAKNEDKDIYFGLGLRSKSHGSNSRGKNEDVTVITGFWSDIDIKGPAHKQQDLPETMEQVTAFLDSLDLTPSIIVNSGNGVHAYWLFDKPIDISTEAHRLNVQSTLQGFQKHINDKAKALEWKLDNTSDLARVLRLVGSVNQKNGSSCVVVSNSDVRYKRSEFSSYKINEVASTQDSKADRTATTEMKNFCTGNASKCLDSCAFMMHCKENSDKLPEPEWHAMISNLALAKDGVEVCHKLSSRYPKYGKAETESKVLRARKEAKPHTCKYIKETLNFDCGECLAKVKAPIGLAVLSGVDKAKNIISRDMTNLEDLYQDDVLESLAYLKQHSMKDYTLFKSGLKARFKAINLVEFEKAVSQQGVKKAKMQRNDSEKLELKGIDLGEAVMPDNYIVDINGIKKIVQIGENLKIIPICNCAIVIKERYDNIDDHNEKVVLAYYIDREWKTCVGDRSEVFNKATLLKFSNKGLKVSTNNATEIVAYLDNYEGVNMENINKKKSIDRLGWVNDNTFFPYVQNDITFETDSENYAVYEYSRPNGTESKWKELLATARENIYGRCMLSASVASALIEKMCVRNFMLHIWDDSKSGKTAILKLALSLWGNPEKLMGTFYSTEVALEQRAATLNNLPLGIDEKQVGSEKKLDFERIVYMLSTGATKSRGQKNGGVQKTRTWRNIALSTGEEPLLKNNSKDGSTNRCMQVNGKPIDNEAFGKTLHTKLTKHYGYGGKDIIEYVCKQQAKNPDYLEELYDTFSTKFKEKELIDSYADYCSALCVGDYMMSTILFNVNSEQAFAEAMEMALAIHKNAISGLGDNIAQKGVDFVQGWLVSNINRFEPDSTPCYGKVDGAKFYVLPSFLETALVENGYTSSVVLDKMAKLGILAKNPNGKPDRKQTWVNGHNVRTYEIRVSNNTIDPLINAKPME